MWSRTVGNRGAYPVVLRKLKQRFKTGSGKHNDLPGGPWLPNLRRAETRGKLGAAWGSRGIRIQGKMFRRPTGGRRWLYFDSKKRDSRGGAESPMQRKISDVAVAEYAHDIQLGLSRVSVPEFDQLPLVGMAAILAVHIKGLGEIEYQTVFKPVAEHFFDIPSMVLPQVLGVLEEVGFVSLDTTGRSINKVTPSVPHFQSVYDGLGGYLGTVKLTEHEDVAVAILNELSSKAEKRDSLIARLGADRHAFEKCETLLETKGGLIVPHRARGQTILTSPAYFADNLQALADLAAAGKARGISKIVNLVKQVQGWPLSMILAQREVAGTKLDDSDINLLRELVATGVLRPPSIERPTAATEHFVFTPKPGAVRLDAVGREIYERAMALVAAVRKGQLLPEQYRIWSPVRLLSALRDRGWIGANSEAAIQYRNLVTLRVGTLRKITSTRYQFHLIEGEENKRAIDEAISLVSTGTSAQSGVKEEARLALGQDERYVQSILGAAKVREISRPTLSEKEQAEMQQLLLDLK